MSLDSVMSSPELIYLYRRFVCRFEEEISEEQRRQLIYIRLYPLREQYKDASTLDVLAKLEADSVFGPNHVEGLLEITRDIGHKNLEKETREFIGDFVKRRSKGKKAKRTNSNLEEGEGATAELMNHEELQLRSTLEVAFALLTVLMRQIDAFQEKLNAGEEERKRMLKIMHEASQTAEKLASTLLPDKEQEASGDSSGDETEKIPHYENVQGLQLQQKPSIKENSPPSCTRDIHYLQQQQHQLSSKHQRPKRQLEASVSLPLSSLPRQQRPTQNSRAEVQSLERVEAGVKPLQQGQRERHFPASSRPRRYTKLDIESSGVVTSQSPSMQTCSGQPHRKSKSAAVQKYTTAPQPVSKHKQGTTASLESVLLQPEDAGDYTGDSGFEEVDRQRQHNQLANSPQNYENSEPPDQPHYYKSLRDDGIEFQYYTTAGFGSP